MKLPTLVLIDNLGVATSSLNALAIGKTVVERLAARPTNSVRIVATSQVDLNDHLDLRTTR